MDLPSISQILEALMPWLLAGAFVLIFAVLVVWKLRRGVEKEAEAAVSPLPQIAAPIEGKTPFGVERSVTEEDVARAKNELRVLGVEREILSYALTRLYEAETEGKLNVDERDGLAGRYSMDLKRVEERVNRGEATIQLRELEKTQSDLVKMFTEKFNDVNQKIADIRSRVGIAPKVVKAPVVEAKEEVKEAEKPEPKPPEVEAAPPKPAPKTKAEERIEEIRAEVMKELERLEQMEAQE